MFQTIYDHTDQKITEELSALTEEKESRPFESIACPSCGKIGGFLRNEDGTYWPDRCIPCDQIA